MRKCEECKTVFTGGYLFEETSQVFCSKDCLEKRYGEETEEMINDESVFWTTWIDDFETTSEILEQELSEKQKEKLKTELEHVKKMSRNYGPFDKSKIERIKSHLSSEQRIKLEEMFDVFEENYNKRG